MSCFPFSSARSIERSMQESYRIVSCGPADGSTRRSEATDDVWSSDEMTTLFGTVDVWSKTSRDFQNKRVDTGIMPQADLEIRPRGYDRPWEALSYAMSGFPFSSARSIQRSMRESYRIISCGPADGSTRRSEATDDVWSKISRDFQTKWVDTGIMPQATIAVCRKDGEVFRHSFGTPEDAIFQMMSMSKLVTTIAILQLQDAGKLSIEDSVSKYLKSFGTRPNVTIKMLLNHTWGQSYMIGFVDGSKHWSAEERAAADQYLPAKQLEYDMASWAEVQSTLPQLFEPGEHFCYSGGPNVASAIVEVVSGQSFAQYIQDKITGPLGMKDTTWVLTSSQKSRLLPAKYEVQDLDYPLSFTKKVLSWLGVKRIPYPDFCTEESTVRGDVGIKGTCADWVRLNRMLLNGGELDGQRILSKKSVDLMCKSSLKDNAELTAPFAYQGIPAEKAEPGFGVSTDEYRVMNSFPGQTFGLGVGVVTDPERAGLVPSAKGTAWSAGLLSTYFAFNVNSDIGVLVLSQIGSIHLSKQALADLLNMTHSAIAPGAPTLLSGVSRSLTSKEKTLG